MKLPCALTIAGSDSCGGAGIQADLKTFSALKVYGATAITAITAQNTKGVYEILPIPPKIIKKQIEAIVSDLPIKYTKTGMLYTTKTVDVVVNAIEEYDIKVVVDPIFKAGGGEILITKNAKKRLISRLIPKSLIVTPNKFEAEAISGIKISDLEDVKKAAEKIHNLGVKYVIIKGGHLNSREIVDVLYFDREIVEFKKPRVFRKLHGLGCTFSAAITAFLARGLNPLNAICEAEKIIADAVKFHVEVGGGRKPSNPMASIYRGADKIETLNNVWKAVKILTSHKEIRRFIPEVGMQVAMASLNARDANDVAAVDGRIVKCLDDVRVGCIRFGASSHMARVILTVMKYDSDIRAALNLKYDLKLLEAMKKNGLKIAYFNRKHEPKKIREIEEATLPWGVREAIKFTGEVPDVIYDFGGLGKEAMIRVLGKTAIDAVEKVVKSIKHIV